MSTPEPQAVRLVARPLLWLILFLHLCITSFNYIMVQPGLKAFGVLPFAIWRFLLASLALWIILLLSQGYRPVRRQDWKSIILLAIFAIPLNQMLYLTGISMVPPSHGALFYATTPIFVLIVARMLIGEPITRLKLIGIPLAFIGVLIVLFERGITFNDTLKGDLILFAGVAAWALYSVWGKPLSERYGALQTTTLAISMGTLTFIPWMPWALRSVDYASLPPLAWGSLAYMVLLTSVIAYTLWYWLMMQMEISKVAVLQNLQPILTMTWTALILASGLQSSFTLTPQALTPIFLSGAATIILGVVITQRG